MAVGRAMGLAMRGGHVLLVTCSAGFSFHLARSSLAKVAAMLARPPLVDEESGDPPLPFVAGQVRGAPPARASPTGGRGRGREIGVETTRPLGGRARALRAHARGVACASASASALCRRVEGVSGWRERMPSRCHRRAACTLAGVGSFVRSGRRARGGSGVAEGWTDDLCGAGDGGHGGAGALRVPAGGRGVRGELVRRLLRGAADQRAQRLRVHRARQRRRAPPGASVHDAARGARGRATHPCGRAHCRCGSAAARRAWCRRGCSRCTGGCTAAWCGAACMQASKRASERASERAAHALLARWRAPLLLLWRTARHCDRLCSLIGCCALLQVRLLQRDAALLQPAISKEGHTVSGVQELWQRAGPAVAAEQAAITALADVSFTLPAALRPQQQLDEQQQQQQQLPADGLGDFFSGATGAWAGGPLPSSPPSS
eukprot:scaffold1998_cov242-Prasinococcus_capsulatus_cf.AAC.1